MKLIPSFGEITQKAKKAIQRFPITLSWAFIGTLFALHVIEQERFNSTFSGSVLLTFILGISWLIATRFFEEQYKKDNEWLFLLTLGFLGLFFNTLPDTDRMSSTNTTLFILYLLGGHLFVFVAPFILSYDKKAYFNYLKSIFIAIARSSFFSLILYLGISLALLAIKHLFNVDFDGKRFFQIFVICVGIVNTWIYLADFPKEIHQNTTVNYTKALEVLVKYILIPLVVLYLIILYAYSFKIVINWDLPKGWVSYLVTALAFLGFSIQLLINPIQKSIASRSIRKFYPWFYILLLPLIVLLFVAVFRRISEYGITENRYFIMVLACYILGMTLYMLVSHKKQTRYFTLSLTGLTLLVSFGFWGAFSVATKSQVNQFEKVFTQIKSANFSTTQKKKNRLNSIVRYLSDKNELDKISAVIGYNPEKAFKSDNKWQLQYTLMDSLNITITDKATNNERYAYYNLSDDLFLSSKGYDYIKTNYLNRYSTQNTINGYRFNFNYENNQIEISNPKKNFNEIISLTDFVARFKNIDSGEQIKDPSLVTVIKEFKRLKVKIVFTNFNISYENDQGRIRGGNTILFIKEN